MSSGPVTVPSPGLTRTAARVARILPAHRRGCNGAPSRTTVGFYQRDGGGDARQRVRVGPPLLHPYSRVRVRVSGWSPILFFKSNPLLLLFYSGFYPDELDLRLVRL